MDTELDRVVASQAQATGIDLSGLSISDLDYLAERIRGVFIGFQARKTWESHIGPTLSHAQVLAITGWTKQGLSHAVRNQRVLKLIARDGSTGYAAAAFDDRSEPLRPIPGIKPVLTVWADADPTGWITAAWLTTSQPELDGLTPRQALLNQSADVVTTLAGQATARLAA